MRRIVGATIGKSGGTQIACRAGLVQVTDPALFARPDGNWPDFVTRVFSLPGVESVEIDRRSGTAAIVYAAQQIPLDRFLEELARALQSGKAQGCDAQSVPLPTGLTAGTKFRLSRRGARLTAWELVHELPGRLRVRDLRLQGDPQQAGRLATSLRLLRGVQSATASSLTGSVVIHFEKATIDRDAVLSYLDHWDQAGALSQPDAQTSRTRWMFAHATLGLAVAGTLFYPPLLPISAAILVASNLRTFQQACRELSRGQVGVPLLHTAIIGATLATGGFLASSMMNWLLLYWEGRQARLAASGRQILVSSVAPASATAWVVRDGVELETPVARLEPGHVITVRSGEWVPVDGRVVSGNAALAESRVRGVNGLVSRSVGDETLAGSYVVEGELRIEALHTGDATLAGMIAHTLSATSAAADAINGSGAAPPNFAERAVPPTLMTAGLGLLVGDPLTAAAVLRPDYTTGPGLGDSATFIDHLGVCIDEGIVVRRADAFRQMAAADVILLDHQPLFETRELQLEDIHVVGDLSTGELLDFAECAVRPFHDRRLHALQAACELRDRARLERPGMYRAGGVDFFDRGRHVRVDGLTRARDMAADDPRPDGNWPLRVSCDGALAGTLTFCAGTESAAPAAIRELRNCGGIDVELLSAGPAAEADRLADWLGVDDVRICPADRSKAQLINLLREGGRTVVYVGDCRKSPLAAQAAHLAIFPGPAPIRSPAARPDSSTADDPSGIWLLQSDYSKLRLLREMALALDRQSRVNCNLILAPNIACVAGAFLFGFTSLAVVVLSNLGTFTMYSRSRGALHRAERRLQNRRQRTLRQRETAVDHQRVPPLATLPSPPLRKGGLGGAGADISVPPSQSVAPTATAEISARSPLETAPIAATIDLHEEVLVSS
ncbi:MAG TPA: hypothetical protein VGM05_16490 [Planctomycetaceae bacterium]